MKLSSHDLKYSRQKTKKQLDGNWGMSLPAVKAGAEKEEIKSGPSLSSHHKHHVSTTATPIPVQNPGNSNPPECVPTLLKGCKPLTHQVAGHRFGHGNLKLGMLQHADGSILKPVQPPPRGDCEVKFYSKVFDPKTQDPVLQTLRPFLPKYLGVCRPITITIENKTGSPEYMKLEDACRRFRNPSILDIKMGRVSYDPHADAAKIAFETGKYPPQKSLGFQLLGARIPGLSPNEAVFYDKKWGRSLTHETITSGLEIFFSGNKACRKHLIKAFLQRLETILIWFESQSQLQFYSSSLLLIYEGEFFDGSSDSDEEFMHKYRTYLPNTSTLHVNECFRAIDKVLQANILQDVREKSLQEASESSNDDNEKEETQSETEKHCIPSISIAGPVCDTITPSQETGAEKCGCDSQTFQTRSGNESGYSSEVDSKSKSRKIKLQQEFVNNLSRRMRQHAMIQCSKYRFPPDLVDVRMIDFTHVFEEQTKDENYIYGLRNLIAHLRHLLKHS